MSVYQIVGYVMFLSYLNLLTSSALGAAASPPSGPPRPSSSFSLASASSSNFWYLSKHCVAVLPTIGAIVLHCVGINLARCNSFSSSSFDHSILRIPGSNHSDHRALHCLGVLRARSEETRAHWFKPYLETLCFAKFSDGGNEDRREGDCTWLSIFHLQCLS